MISGANSRSRCLALFALLASIGSSAEVSAWELAIPREQHAWARFEPGAWKRVRVVTSSYDHQGELAALSTAVVTSTLLRVDQAGFTLRVETILELAGKQIVANPQDVTQTFSGGPGQNALVPLGESPVEIDGVLFPCTVQQTEVIGTSSLTRTRFYYSASVAPYILKRESESIDLATQQRFAESVVEIIAIDFPYHVLTQLRPTAQFRATERGPNGASLTTGVSSVDVPGGVVSQITEELDPQGRMRRLIDLELVAYGFGGEGFEAPHPRRLRLLHRRQAKQAAKAEVRARRAARRQTP